MTYDFQTLKEAILFNSKEVLPTDEAQLDKEIRFLVDNANQSEQPIRHYIGFEISGQIHIGTGIAASLKIKKLQEADVVCSIWLADYHTWLNNKLDGTIETARKVAKLYFGPVMRECLRLVGGDTEKLEILHAEEVYNSWKVNNQSFWDFDLNVCKELTLSRVLKSVSIMGKTAGEDVTFGTLRYPALQTADAYFMQTHLVHAGMDQRKCHVLMREIAYKLGENYQLKIGGKSIKPIAIHHNLLLGLDTPTRVSTNTTVTITNETDTSVEIEEVFTASKMSKSKPDSAIWVHDSTEEIARKLKKAYCPIVDPNLDEAGNRTIQNQNPILDWCKNMIYPAGQIVSVNRSEKFGGNKTFASYNELESDYFAGNLHPLDLKNGVAQTLGKWFTPIREFVETHPDGLELFKSARK